MLWFLATLLAFQAPGEVKVSSHAYAPQSPYTLRVDTKLVEVAAVVRDAHGKVVDGLTKDDFRLLDDGKPRLIDDFVVEKINAPAPRGGPEIAKSTLTPIAARQPRFLALFIDDVNAKDIANAGDLKRTQIAAEKFVKDALKTDVRIGVFTASGKPTLDFTADQARLVEAIAALKPHMRMSEDGLSGHCPWVPPYLAYRITYENSSLAMAMVYQGTDCTPPPPRDQIRMQAEETWRQMKRDRCRLFG